MSEETALDALGRGYDPEAGAAAVPSARLEADLPDRKPKLAEDAAVAEAHRCLYCYDAPCIKACPTGIDIPEFIRKIGTGNMSGSAKTILEANILGLSCARVCPTEVLCEGDCVYNDWKKPPIQIGKLQRVATEHAYDKGMQFFTRGEPTGKRVALIGGGPASLACAHELAILGHESVIFEAREMPGGLNSTGVAPYKLQLPDSIREVNYILEIGGIELRCGVEVGRDVTFEQLEQEFDAIFIGFGLGPDGRLGLPGEDLDGVVGAVEFIEQLKMREDFSLDGLERAAIIGGGNTAIDCVRELVGLGVKEVHMIYRRDEAAMSGYAHEWDAAKQEGARAVWWAQPLSYVATGGKVSGVECARTRVGGDDGSGRRPLVVDQDERFVVDADLVLLAVGQGKLGELLGGIEGVELEWGRVLVDPKTGQTGNPRYFAGGDCANGGKEVVNAAAEGKLAAHGIDAWIAST